MSQPYPQPYDPQQPPQVTPPQWQQPPYTPPAIYRQAPYPHVPMHVHPKSPAAALVMSLFIPGLGSMYAGKAGWGILILVLWLVSWVMLLAVVGLITLPACWIWGMAAGYSDARAWNRARGIES